jgi:DHA1 family tetracycline resistance protein-like MFS transporter
LPESLDPANRKPFSMGRPNPIGSLVLLRSHPELFRLAAIHFLSFTAHEVVQIYALYVIYRYDEKAAGFASSASSTVIISGGLVRPLVASLGERRTLYLGYFLGALGMVLMGWALSGPPAQGMMTHRVGESEQGELQGAISSMRAIAMLTGPGLFSFTFAWFINAKHGWVLPGAPWYLAAVLLFIAMAMAFSVEQPEMSAAGAVLAPAAED